MLVIVLAIAATACGSSSGSEAGPPTTTSTKPSTDQRVIAAGLIRPSDLPGYSHKPPSTNSSSDIYRTAKGLPECAHFLAVHKNGGSKRISPQFQRGGSHVADSADVYASSATLATQLELYRDPTTLACIRSAFQKAMTDQFKSRGVIDKLDVSPIAIDEIGDGSFAVRVTVAVTASGQSSTLLIDLDGVIVGRYAISFGVDGTTPAQLAELETTLLPKLVERMKQAGA